MIEWASSTLVQGQWCIALPSVEYKTETGVYKILWATDSVNINLPNPTHTVNYFFFFFYTPENFYRHAVLRSQERTK